MTDSIALGPDGHTNHVLSLMRNAKSEGELKADMAIIPGFELHVDPALQMQGVYRSPEGRILELDATMAEPGGWTGLHLLLPASSLQRFGVLGFACRTSAPELLMLRACIRSGHAEGFTDCFFDKHILVRPEAATHVDALSVHHQESLPAEAPWREIVFFLPTESFQLSLIDLRVFLV